MIEKNQLISHLYQNRDNGQWMIQTNDEHQKGVADMAASFAGQFGLPSWGGVRSVYFMTKERNGRHSSNTYAR